MPPQDTEQIRLDHQFMRRAIELAWRGQGWVEPNPMVGCVIVKDGNTIGEGWHEKFGQAHAEVNAIQDVARRGIESTAGATAYVSLEPCSHTGKTGPCVVQLIEAKIARVVVAELDDNPQVNGRGIQQLEAAGIAVTVGIERERSRNLLAPYRTRTKLGRPWTIAKWAMTMDGKIATANGDSKWISNPASRERVHAMRGRIDGIMVGAGTARIDDPLLTARGEVRRVPRRIVMDTPASLNLNSQLVQTAKEFPTTVVAGPHCQQVQIEDLTAHGVEVWVNQRNTHLQRLIEYLQHFAQAGGTNLLVEGGSQLLGTMFENHLIDEVHIFVGPKVLGGQGSVSPVAGRDLNRIDLSEHFRLVSVDRLEDDVHLQYRRDHA